MAAVVRFGCSILFIISFCGVSSVSHRRLSVSPPIDSTHENRNDNEV